MPTQSYLEAVSASSQALLATVLILFVGYLAGGTRIFGPDTALGLRRIASSILLPALVISTVGSEVSYHSILHYWPIAAFTGVLHLLSLAVSYVIFYRLFGVAGWIVEALTFNSLTSFPLLILAGLARSPGLLNHIFRTDLESTEMVIRRATSYILLNAAISEVLRIFVAPYLPKAKPSIFLPADTEDSLESEAGSSTPPGAYNVHSSQPGETEPDERTPLVASSRPHNHPTLVEVSPSKGGFLSYLNPLVVSAVAALVLALVPGVQNFVFGRRGGEIGDGERIPGLVGGTLGTMIAWLGGSFAIFEIIGAGGSLRWRDTSSSKDAQTLGAILSIVIWRFAAVPSLAMTLVWAARKLGPKVFLDDPVLHFVLVLVTLTPPLLHLNPDTTTHQTTALLQTYIVTPFLACFPIAAGIAVTGTGIIFESKFDWKDALKKAAGGGVAGALAMVLQVLTLMPLRTIMNFQYRNGGSFTESSRRLWADGGFVRYYAGLTAALFQGPLSRFGDTAANAGIIALLSPIDLPILVKTVGSSIAAATFRMTLTPIDALKTTQQTQGAVAGLRLLKERIKDRGIGSLWYGAIATAAATFVGHYPWFATYNFLSEHLPHEHNVLQKLLRQAVIGFSASVVSDSCSNSLRVLKTYRQTHEGDVGYWTATQAIVAKDGVLGLFGRGLATRILTNGLQGLLFSVLWKLIQEAIDGKGEH